jgi:serine/threonine-protein kinase
MSTSVGTLLSNRYRLDEQIGVGGMSRVYRAFDTLLERQVAIKTLNREVASESAQLERFRREARAVARLNHPHIVTVIDAGEDDGFPYIVFEYVEGETLKQRIRRLGRLPVPEALAYAIEIGRGLEAAHCASIVHRDVKPQNVLIDAEGGAKITDFGIARQLTEDGLTADGRVLGTTDYVSPEQAMGHDVTGQSDVYSLGIVLYEMLTGEVPFSAENQVAVAMKHVREEVPDVQLRRPEVSAATAALVDRATAKDVATRYPDMAAMIGELERALAVETMRSGGAGGEATMVLNTLPQPVRQRVPLRMRRRGVAVLLVVALLVAGAVVALVLASHTHRGTGKPADLTPQAAQEAVSLNQNAAHSYHPYGDQPENPGTAGFAVDGDPGTTWNTFQYQQGYFQEETGTGLYLDAAPGVAARSLEVETPTPGLVAEVWATNNIVDLPTGLGSASLQQRGWTQVGPQTTIATSGTKIPIDTAGNRYRYYLFWITKLPPGPYPQQAQISELVLYE